ncbi:GNAT family N-acetyltransferase [Streptomyces aureus]|uniref:GNAT family N-acetyltransferase n=1 Tax=Streptomyces aureus TaxID=193461 RepID=UPI0007C4E4DD|nr:GNAT family protein [Streptomyces aureus]
MPRIERLRTGHAHALLAFERENRAYFAASIPDRGDAFFTRFDSVLRERLDEQGAGLAHFHLVVDDDGTVLARLNLVDVADGSADLGYRVAERAAGRGLATAAVREVCGLAAGPYGLRTLRAAATVGNTASRKVLDRTGFTLTGRTELNGLPALTYARELPAGGPGVPPAGPGDGQESGSATGLIGDW